ncbi:hypothetical protein H8F21_14575 [Pseudomonas sp. P66]|uniref:Conjugal transfer protein TraK n=1 Tax=Pseudomonas arcuscaelestis TaxID=2710591 RepID=A0ABS2BYT8_9PSED|nr:hypothetical protein [Pseudomonas arcuscaelestis]MBM5458790.1 hypothetical protein [Pseudomonas arcuscaelestis]
MKKTILAAMVAAVLATPVFAVEECNRSPRSVVYENSPVDVYISNDTQRAEVIFPESYLQGVNRERPDGLELYPTPIKNKLAFNSLDTQYVGLVTVDGASGQSYLINLITRPGCADSQVSIELQAPVDRSQLERNGKGHVKGLMNYMFDGTVPNGYRKNNFSKLTKQQRVVFRQGSVEFSLQSQLVGPKYTGTTYEVVNRGRTAFKVAIDQIDYSNKAVRESIGIARQVSMLPSSRVLGPSPEYISEIYGDSHRGLLFIVSEKSK